jgi:hypothetical protein
VPIKRATSFIPIMFKLPLGGEAYLAGDRLSYRCCRQAQLFPSLTAVLKVFPQPTAKVRRASKLSTAQDLTQFLELRAVGFPRSDCAGNH